jgi:4-amino-4-deoxychorismate lyase
MEFHQARLNRSLAELFPGAAEINLAKEIVVPADCCSGPYKVRVLYGPSVETIEISDYHFRSIESLKMVHHDSLDYHLKYTDRLILNDLFAQRGECDDIIIVKNRQVTDSFAANLLFFDGRSWFTPEKPLLKGTKRQALLDRGIISEKEIGVDEIFNYQKVGLINAMIDFEEMPIVPIEKVFV